MKKAFISVDDLQIAYYIHNPDQTNTIFFLHGNSCSSRNWYKQVSSSLLSGYRLVTIDLPNHGDSDAIDAAGDFSLPAIAKIVGAAINQLADSAPFIICGVSLGTNIVTEMLNDIVQPNGLLVAGPAVAGKNFEIDKIILPGTDLTAMSTENLPIEMLTKYTDEVFVSADLNDRELFLTDYYAVKGNFRSSLFATIAAGIYSDEVAILQKINIPVCIVFGKDEKVVNTDYLNDAPFNIWNKTIYKIPGAGHLVNIDAAEDFNKLLAAFAENIFTTGFA